MTDKSVRVLLTEVPPVWTAEMDEVIGPHMGTAFPGERPGVADPLPHYVWHRIEASTGQSIGYLWLQGGPDEVEVSLVIRAELQRSGFGDKAMELAEAKITEEGGTCVLGVVDQENPAAGAVAALLQKRGYASHPTFSEALLARLGSMTFVKRLSA